MQRFALGIAVILPTFVGALFAQHAVDPGQRYHRLICLVHLTGTGTPADPIRPEYVPSEEDRARLGRAGILAWSFQVADDKKMAIVHFVAADPNAFDGILADKRSEVRVFEVGKHDKDEIEKEMRKHKKDFDLDSLKVVVQ